MLNEEWSRLASNSIAHAAEMCQASIQSAAAQYERPSVLYRPKLSIDGNQWCALYGENLQDGVAGFGDSPADAMWRFDQEWNKSLAKEQT